MGKLIIGQIPSKINWGSYSVSLVFVGAEKVWPVTPAGYNVYLDDTLMYHRDIETVTSGSARGRYTLFNYLTGEVSASYIDWEASITRYYGSYYQDPSLGYTLDYLEYGSNTYSQLVVDSLDNNNLASWSIPKSYYISGGTYINIYLKTTHQFKFNIYIDNVLKETKNLPLDSASEILTSYGIIAHTRNYEQYLDYQSRYLNMCEVWCTWLNPDNISYTFIKSESYAFGYLEKLYDNITGRHTFGEPITGWDNLENPTVNVYLSNPRIIDITVSGNIIHDTTSSYASDFSWASHRYALPIGEKSTTLSYEGIRGSLDSDFDGLNVKFTCMPEYYYNGNYRRAMIDAIRIGTGDIQLVQSYTVTIPCPDESTPIYIYLALNKPPMKVVVYDVDTNRQLMSTQISTQLKLTDYTINGLQLNVNPTWEGNTMNIEYGTYYNDGKFYKLISTDLESYPGHAVSTTDQWYVRVPIDQYDVRYNVKAIPFTYKCNIYLDGVLRESHDIDYHTMLIYDPQIFTFGGWKAQFMGVRHNDHTMAMNVQLYNVDLLENRYFDYATVEHAGIMDSVLTPFSGHMYSIDEDLRFICNIYFTTTENTNILVNQYFDSSIPTFSRTLKLITGSKTANEYGDLTISSVSPTNITLTWDPKQVDNKIYALDASRIVNQGVTVNNNTISWNPTVTDLSVVDLYFRTIRTAIPINFKEYVDGLFVTHNDMIVYADRPSSITTIVSTITATRSDTNDGYVFTITGLPDNLQYADNDFNGTFVVQDSSIGNDFTVYLLYTSKYKIIQLIVLIDDLLAEVVNVRCDSGSNTVTTSLGKYETWFEQYNNSYCIKPVIDNTTLYEYEIPGVCGITKATNDTVVVLKSDIVGDNSGIILSLKRKNVLTIKSYIKENNSYRLADTSLIGLNVGDKLTTPYCTFERTSTGLLGTLLNYSLDGFSAFAENGEELYYRITASPSPTGDTVDIRFDPDLPVPIRTITFYMDPRT